MKNALIRAGKATINFVITISLPLWGGVFILVTMIHDIWIDGNEAAIVRACRGDNWFWKL